jgi:two-component system, NarL family, nitrate/nitrite response regulator NarL
LGDFTAAETTSKEAGPKARLRLVVADDHPLFLEAVRLHIERARPEAEIVVAASLDDAIALSLAEPADILLLDFSMPGMNGVAGIPRARLACPSVPIVIMSGTATPSDVTAAVRAGANGFLPKSLGPEVFMQAINIVLAGGTYLPTEIISGVTAAAAAPPPRPPSTVEMSTVAGLTPREIQVLQAIVNGKSNKEIGRELELQEVTVKLHARRVYQKLGARNRAEVTAIAIEQKIVQRDSGTAKDGDA